MSERELERIRRNVEMAGWTDPDDIFRLIKENAELRELIRNVLNDSVWMPSEDHPEDTIIAYLDKAGWENLIASFSPKEEKEEG